MFLTNNRPDDNDETPVATVLMSLFHWSTFEVILRCVHYCNASPRGVCQLNHPKSAPTAAAECFATLFIPFPYCHHCMFCQFPLLPWCQYSSLRSTTHWTWCQHISFLASLNNTLKACPLVMMGESKNNKNKLCETFKGNNRTKSNTTLLL